MGVWSDQTKVIPNSTQLKLKLELSLAKTFPGLLLTYDYFSGWKCSVKAAAPEPRNCSPNSGLEIFYLKIEIVEIIELEIVTLASSDGNDTLARGDAIDNKEKDVPKVIYYDPKAVNHQAVEIIEAWNNKNSHYFGNL